MKQIIVFLSFAFFLFSTTMASGQRGDGHQERWEKYKAEKVAFLTTNLDLSPEEAQKFWPVYNQMEKEKSEVQQKRHELEAKVREAAETLSDEQIITLTREFAHNQEEEGTLSTKYNEKFLKILAPKKVLQLYKVEGEFRMYLFKKYRDKDKKDNSDKQ
jgi:Spy/CpxP family protein refolding chaperone